MGTLFLDLERKINVWRFYAYLNPTSPMSWGAWILIAVFPVFALLAVAGLPDGFPQLAGKLRELPVVGKSTMAPLIDMCGVIRSPLAVAGIGLGVALGIYTGVLLSGFNARPFWHSALLGPLFLVSGLSTGAALLVLGAGTAEERHLFSHIDLGLIVVEIALVFLFLIDMLNGDALQQHSVFLVLGGGAFFPWSDYKEVIDWQVNQVGLSLLELEKTGVHYFPRKTPVYSEPGTIPRLATPSGKIEFFSSTLQEAGFDPLPRYTAPKVPPSGYYHLNYGRAPQHSFSRTQNNPVLYQLMPENVVWIHPLVAAQFEIANGSYIRLLNQDGIVSNKVRVRVTERTRPDSVWLVHGFGHEARGLTLAYGRGANDAALMTRILYDPIMGSTGMRGNFVTFRKERSL